MQQHSVQCKRYHQISSTQLHPSLLVHTNTIYAKLLYYTLYGVHQKSILNLLAQMLVNLTLERFPSKAKELIVIFDLQKSACFESRSGNQIADCPCLPLFEIGDVLLILSDVILIVYNQTSLAIQTTDSCPETFRWVCFLFGTFGTKFRTSDLTK